MKPLDGFLPNFTYSETHSRATRAEADALMMAAFRYRPDDDPFFRAMIGLREVPMRFVRRLGGRPAPAPFGLDNFTVLEKRPAEMLVYGLVGRFWQSDYGLVSIADAEAFVSVEAAGVAKLALAIWVEQREDASRLLCTETRVFCPDAEARRRFAPYWYLIRPVSGIIRQRILASIANAATKEARPMPH